MHSDRTTDRTPADIRDLQRQLDDAEIDARAVAADLSEEWGIRRPGPESWSVAECLDHLAVANRVYLASMEGPANRARQNAKWRRGPAEPGLLGRWFVASLEPPVRRGMKLRAPEKIQPRAVSLAEAIAGFLASQVEVRAFLDQNADLDLARIRFINPFIRAIRFSLATGLHVITAHERRHLAQARRARESIRQNVPDSTKSAPTRLRE